MKPIRLLIALFLITTLISCSNNESSGKSPKTDNQEAVKTSMTPTKTPHIFILQKTAEGNRVEYIGAIDDNTSSAEAVETKYVENAVDALLNGQEPPVRTTKAVGCSIKT